MPAPNQIVFFDTTLRDGEQSPGCTMHHDEKLRMAHQLATLGVDVLEAGFAIASDGDFRAVNAIAREVKGTRIASLARCKRDDIEAAARSIEPATRARIHTFLSTSDLHLAAKLQITREQALTTLKNEVGLSDPMANQEVERYTFWAPGQANAYFYGYTRLRELRGDVEKAMGSRFNPKAFHDFILAQGLLPPHLLRKAVFEDFVGKPSRLRAS